MITNTPFIFGDSAYDTSKVFYARLTGEINRKDQLLDALYWALRLPSYFGFNWDALLECMTDFHWVKERVIVLVHDGLPKLPDDELKVYLEILRDAVISWESDGEHQLEIVFGEPDKERVLQILNN